MASLSLHGGFPNRRCSLAHTIETELDWNTSRAAYVEDFLTERIVMEKYCKIRLLYLSASYSG